MFNITEQINNIINSEVAIIRAGCCIASSRAEFYGQATLMSAADFRTPTFTQLVIV